MFILALKVALGWMLAPVIIFAGIALVILLVSCVIYVVELFQGKYRNRRSTERGE